MEMPTKNVMNEQFLPPWFCSAFLRRISPSPLKLLWSLNLYYEGNCECFISCWDQIWNERWWWPFSNIFEFVSLQQKIIIEVPMHCDRCKSKAMKSAVAKDGMLASLLESWTEPNGTWSLQTFLKILYNYS